MKNLLLYFIIFSFSYSCTDNVINELEDIVEDTVAVDSSIIIKEYQSNIHKLNGYWYKMRYVDSLYMTQTDTLLEYVDLSRSDTSQLMPTGNHPYYSFDMELKMDSITLKEGEVHGYLTYYYKSLNGIYEQGDHFFRHDTIDDVPVFLEIAMNPFDSSTYVYDHEILELTDSSLYMKRTRYGIPIGYTDTISIQATHSWYLKKY